MKNKLERIQIKVIDQMEYKETHGLFINGQLHHTGTENECTFLKLKFLKETKPSHRRAGEESYQSFDKEE